MAFISAHQDFQLMWWLWSMVRLPFKYYFPTPKCKFIQKACGRTVQLFWELCESKENVFLFPLPRFLSLSLKVKAYFLTNNEKDQNREKNPPNSPCISIAKKKLSGLGGEKNPHQQTPKTNTTYTTQQKPSTIHAQNTECVSSCRGKVTWITWANHILSTTGIRSAAFPALEKQLREYAWKRLQYHWNLHSPNLQMPETGFFPHINNTEVLLKFSRKGGFHNLRFCAFVMPLYTAIVQ